MMEFKGLDPKYKLAIQLKYSFETYAVIAERCGTTEGNVQQWFFKGGLLATLFEEYRQDMDDKRQKELEKGLFLTDREWLTMTRNLSAMFNKYQLRDYKVPLVDKKGNLVMNAQGEPFMVDHIPDINFQDVVRAFVMQRTIANKPAKFDPRLEATNENDDVQDIIKELGLTEEDFTDEKRADTYERIRQYTDNK